MNIFLFEKPPDTQSYRLCVGVVRTSVSGNVVLKLASILSQPGITINEHRVDKTRFLSITGLPANTGSQTLQRINQLLETSQAE